MSQIAKQLPAAKHSVFGRPFFFPRDRVSMLTLFFFLRALRPSNIGLSREALLARFRRKRAKRVAGIVTIAESARTRG